MGIFGRVKSYLGGGREDENISMDHAERERKDRLAEKQADSMMKSPNDGASIQDVFNLVKQREITPEEAKYMLTSAMHKNAEMANNQNSYIASNHHEKMKALEWAITQVDGKESNIEQASELTDKDLMTAPTVPLNSVIELARVNGGLSKEAVDKLLTSVKKGNVNAIDTQYNDKESDEFTVVKRRMHMNAVRAHTPRGMVDGDTPGNKVEHEPGI